MTKKKQQDVWLDSRLIRPPGWSPPKPTEQEYSSIFASVEGLQKQVLITSHLSSLICVAKFAYQCHLFYTDNLSPMMMLGEYWSPWRYPGEEITTIQSMLPHVETDIRELCQAWLPLIQTLETLNQEWADALARFFGLITPNSDRDYQELRDQVEAYRKENGALWVNHPDFPPLILQLEQIVIGMQRLYPKLSELLQKYQTQISPDDLKALFGDQRVKDRIDSARGEPSHKRAIKVLDKALRYNPTDMQTNEIYMELGFRYGELGEIEQAIENYTRSINASKLPNPLVHYWRGELYYSQKEWDKAAQDFEQAVALGVYSPEREQAQRYILELRSQSSNVETKI
jgi:tetratricopeptide (TPR) repeat protein